MQRTRHWLISLFALSFSMLPGCGSDESDADSNGACTIADLGDGTSAIRCPDGTELVVSNGKDGENGSKGDKGDTGEDGKDAESPCSLTENADGTHSLTCGDKSVVIGDDCEHGFQGDLWVTAPGSHFHDASLTLFQATSCTWIRGGVYVEEYSAKALPKALARIERVDGDLYIGYDYGNDELESVSFAALKTIGGGLHFTWNHALKEIGDFPVLETIEGSISAAYNLELRKIGNFPRLASVERLEFRVSPKLETIGSFDELVSTGTLEWYWLDSMTNMGSFPLLERAATFNFGGNHAIESLPDFPALSAIEGASSHHYAVEIWDNDKLSSIDGLKQVKSVAGKIYIADNPELLQSDVDDFIDALDEVSGTVTTCGNKGGSACL